MCGKVVSGSNDEACAGGALFVGEDLGVGQPAVVIDHGVHVVIADAASADLFAAAVGAPPSSLGDAAELFDVDVDQLAGTVPLIAHASSFRRFDEYSGHRVAVAQIGLSVAAQDASHGAGRDAQFGSQPVLAPPMGAASCHNLLFHLGSCAAWTTMRTRGPIPQPRISFSGKTADPGVHTLA